MITRAPRSLACFHLVSSWTSGSSAAMARRMISCCRSETRHITRGLDLQRGGRLPEGTVQIRYAAFGDPSKPVVLLCPSMSNTPFPVDVPEMGEAGWWNSVVGVGPEFGLQLDKFHVIVPSPLGSPFGSSSPLTPGPAEGGSGPSAGSPSPSPSSSSSSSSSSSERQRWGPDFPAITPADMADAHALLLDDLGIKHVHAVVGGSMGGMQALQFAVRHPDRVNRCAAIASTGHTSPATVALRSVQRSAIRMDAAYAGGHFDPDDVSTWPVEGMALARRFGTLCYRSRSEFDARFSWDAPPDIDAWDNDAETRAEAEAEVQAEAGTGEGDEKEGDEGMTNTQTSRSSTRNSSGDHGRNKFDVERYLDHQAAKFEGAYDPNCYMTLSEAMDRMDLSRGYDSLDVALARFSGQFKQVMLLPFSTDVLMPPSELTKLGEKWKRAGAKVHSEVLESTYGHDAFLVSSAATSTGLNARLDAFLTTGASGARKVYEQTVRDVGWVI